MKRGGKNLSIAPWKVRVRKLPVVITCVTLFAVFYQLSPFMGIPAMAIFVMFILSPFLVIYMAWVILKYGTSSKYTFDERYYEDKT